MEPFDDLSKWVKEIFLDLAPKKKIHALYFGIGETTEGFEIRCSGSKRYSRTDEDWPCIVDFVPSVPTFRIRNQSNYLSWTDFLSGFGEALRATFFSSRICIPQQVRYVAFGFDEGSLCVAFDSGRR